MRHIRTAVVVSVCFLLTVTNVSMAGKKGFDPFSSNKTGGRQSTHNAIASLEFVDTPITTVFRMISDLTGWSIVMSPDVSHKPPRINIWIKNLTPNQVLDQVCNLGELAMERKGDTINVMTFAEFTRIYGLEKRVVPLKHGNAKKIAAILKPFAAKEDQARILADEDGNNIVLLVAKPLIESLEKLIKTVDVPFEKDIVKIIPLTYQEAGLVGPALEDFITERSKGARRSSGKVNAGPAKDGQFTSAGEGWLVKIMIEPKLNVLVIRGLKKDVERLLEIVKELDVQSDVTVHGYELKYTNAADVFDTLEEIVQEDLRNNRGGRYRMPPRLRISVSEQNNRIVVEGSQEDQKRISSIIKAIDKPLPAGTGGMRVYRLENTSAQEVAKVLQDLIEEENRRGSDALAKQERKTNRGNKNQSNPKVLRTEKPSEKSSQFSAGDVLPPRVSTAPEINAVIIKASAVEQEELSQIIKELDMPREQVILEATLVTIRSNDTFDLGIDVGFSELSGLDMEQVGFSTFGLGEVTPQTGGIRIGAPSFGFNYSLFNSNDFSLVLKALKTIGDVKITSAPKILLEDNAVGEISQFNQEPYEVTSQGESSTISSFGGFVDAGTALTVSPSIADDGWLRLQYSINLSSFGNRTAQQELANLPPPKRETKTNGIVRIPSEHMVMLGGLTVTREDNSEESVPFVSNIPILGELFKNRSKGKIHEKLYIFIRPIVLRDPSFKDLIYLSEQEKKAASIANENTPENPMKMRIFE